VREGSAAEGTIAFEVEDLEGLHLPSRAFIKGVCDKDTQDV
jgi:hypothetical protein